MAAVCRAQGAARAHRHRHGRPVQRQLRDRRRPYVSGRGRTWVKKTCPQRETLPIAGFALDGHDWDGLYLARRKGQDLVYAGQGRSWFRQGVRRRSAQTAQTADPQDPALYEEDRPQGHLGERLFLEAAIRKLESEVATGGRENKKS